MTLYDKDGNKVNLVEKFKTITLKAWNGSYPCRGDNTCYTIFIPGIFMESTPAISGNVNFTLMGIDQRSETVSVATDVTSLLFISQTTTGLLITLDIGSNYQVNAGIAIPTTDIVITSA